jgi:hypothetical protein
MKAKTSVIILIAILVSAFSIASDRFSKLSMLEGTWVMQTKKGLLYEQWKKTGSDELQSKSFKLNGKDTVHLENVRLVEKDNDIFYIPVVKGQNNGQPVSFKLVSVNENKFTFENKLHDFPQRIIYNLVSGDSIVARVEGQKNGFVSGSDFYFKRVRGVKEK